MGMIAELGGLPRRDSIGVHLENSHTPIEIDLRKGTIEQKQCKKKRVVIESQHGPAELLLRYVAFKCLTAKNSNLGRITDPRR